MFSYQCRSLVDFFISVVTRDDALAKTSGAEQYHLTQMIFFLILKYAISNSFMLKLQKHFKWTI